jgi:hypothetical protein
MVPTRFDQRAKPDIGTAWLEAVTDFDRRLQLTLGGYWGRETGSSSVVLPKVVAVHRPDPSTWWSLVVNPIFRSDAAELSPVEALADPKGLNYLNFGGGGYGRSYEARYQRQGGRSSTTTASLTYQRVRDLLIDVEDPAWTGLPTRVLVDRGDRWVADAAYEQWLSNLVTGRAWVRWQDSDGRYPDVQVTGTEWLYTPEWQTGGRLDYIDAMGWRIGLEAVYTGNRFADPENTRRLPGYSVYNLLIQYQRNLRENYFLRLNNFTGKDYETFAGFPQPGWNVLGGLEYRF